jgi:flagellar biogenesis protein FliO
MKKEEWRMKNLPIKAACLVSSFFILHSALAEGTNSSAAMIPNLPDMSASLLRVFGALGLVIGVFLGGVWLYRNWQRLALRRNGNLPRLNVLEVRSLGGRHALYVVGYEQERFLLASSPAGINLLSHLPSADEAAPASEGAAPAVSFPQALAQMLKGK